MAVEAEVNPEGFRITAHTISSGKANMEDLVRGQRSFIPILSSEDGVRLAMVCQKKLPLRMVRRGFFLAEAIFARDLSTARLRLQRDDLLKCLAAKLG